MDIRKEEKETGGTTRNGKLRDWINWMRLRSHKGFAEGNITKLEDSNRN